MSSRAARWFICAFAGSSAHKQEFGPKSPALSHFSVFRDFGRGNWVSLHMELILPASRHDACLHRASPLRRAETDSPAAQTARFVGSVLCALKPKYEIANGAARHGKDLQRMIVALDGPLSEGHKREAILHPFGDNRIHQDLRVSRQTAKP
jgi:hypothetical protein